MELNAVSGAVFFAVTFVAAAINSVAGGGTFLTFPVFIMNGLSPLQANIMSTMALWPGTLASVAGYRNILVTDRKLLAPYLIIGVLGGAAGSFLLLTTSELVFRALIPWLLLVATLIFTFGRHAIASLQRFDLSEQQRRVGSLVLQVVIALYGGYFGAGIGILTLAMLQILGHTQIHQMNAMKTVLAAAINAATALIFIASGKVVWSLLWVMVLGGISGGYFGARFAQKMSPSHVRTLVSVIGFSLTAYFFLSGA
jgi:uncharacterized membrane protein YfcA